jgi:predicted enzyme related to lactoylglutathione lyase
LAQGGVAERVMTSLDPVTQFAHVAICVSDIEVSDKFYRDALGFEFDHAVAGGEVWGKLTELTDFRYRANFYKRDGVMIELLEIESPEVTGSKERRPMNQLGMTHLSLVVNDLDEVLDRIEKCGGRAYGHTMVESSFGEIIFCTDPDGVRIELWRKPTA